LEAEESIKKDKMPSFMKNVLMLMIAQVAVKLLGFIYRIIIMKADGFGDVGNGYYNAGYQIYSLLLTISSIGIPSAIAKLVSERIAVRRQ
jgi:stage V sporulation protein B